MTLSVLLVSAKLRYHWRDRHHSRQSAVATSALLPCGPELSRRPYPSLSLSLYIAQLSASGPRGSKRVQRPESGPLGAGPRVPTFLWRWRLDVRRLGPENPSREHRGCLCSLLLSDCASHTRPGAAALSCHRWLSFRRLGSLNWFNSACAAAQRCCTRSAVPSCKDPQGTLQLKA